MLRLQIFRAVHHLLLTAIHNPFLSLPPTFRAKHAPIPNGLDAAEEHQPAETPNEKKEDGTIRNTPVPTSKMFITAPDEIDGETLKRSVKFQDGMKRIGDMLSGGRI